VPSGNISANSIFGVVLCDRARRMFDCMSDIDIRLEDLIVGDSPNNNSANNICKVELCAVS